MLINSLYQSIFVLAMNRRVDFIGNFLLNRLCILHYNLKIASILNCLASVSSSAGLSLRSSSRLLGKSRVLRLSEDKFQIVLEEDEKSSHDCSKIFLKHKCCLLKRGRHMLEVFPIYEAWNYFNHFKEEILVTDICLILCVALLRKLKYLIDDHDFFLQIIHINLGLLDDSYKPLERPI